MSQLKGNIFDAFHKLKEDFGIQENNTEKAIAWFRKTVQENVKQDDPVTIRKILRDVDINLSDSTKILYGGSVTEKNIAEILALDEVDGALIGGASLDPKSFSKICRIAKTI